MCCIVGIVSNDPVNQSIYDALTVLQHRGQDAAGIMTCDGSQLYLRKSNGLVRDVFHTRHMLRLRGTMGIGHVRYPTAGCESSAEAQPFYVNSPYGITLAHNGNLINAGELKENLFREDLRHINTDSDSEVLLNVFAHELQLRGKLQVDVDDVFAAVAGVHKRCHGAYAAVAMITGYGIVAFRDPHGIRPLVYGRRDTDKGPEFMAASESVALDLLGFELIGDVRPGEAVFMSRDGTLVTRQCDDNPQCSPCIFEHVYLARPDSIMDNVSVYKARLRMGEKLAEKIRRERPDHDIDVVIPIPDTSRTAAVQLARRRGAVVTAIAGKAKLEKVQAIGADQVIARDEDIVDCLGEKFVDVVVDNVAGPCFGGMLKVLKRGGRFVSSGAIAGPLVELDMRDFYLKDLTLIGCTAWDEPVFPNLVSYIEKGEIKPLLAKTFPLKKIVGAQREFTEKKHVGKFVLIPPPINDVNQYLS